MLHVLWTVLNVVAFLGIVYLCIRITSHIKEKLGSLAAFVFVVCLLSFANRNVNENPSSNTQVSSEGIENTYHAEVRLHKTPITKFDLHVLYGRKKVTNELIVLYGYATTTGLISGIEQETAYKSITPGEDGKSINYHITTTTEWKFLGITLYTNTENYSGVILVQ